jgi:hypothetical protein
MPRKRFTVDQIIDHLREAEVPRLGPNRYLAEEIATASEMVSAGTIVSATDGEPLLDIIGGN